MQKKFLLIFLISMFISSVKLQQDFGFGHQLQDEHFGHQLQDEHFGPVVQSHGHNGILSALNNGLTENNNELITSGSGSIVNNNFNSQPGGVIINNNRLSVNGGHGQIVNNNGVPNF
ncbi:unnamed protein product [Brachionus calyciflorus]|uniref:Uncharacterized protein n=1 Tax=Brachionus calyciflorus TaxID=104777 RepID=A0A813X204_9BILA|nr:unnamed protein product [Brachionus calyciflorus]